MDTLKYDLRFRLAKHNCSVNPEIFLSSVYQEINKGHFDIGANNSRLIYSRQSLPCLSKLLAVNPEQEGTIA
jgi:hypothetical protein